MKFLQLILPFIVFIIFVNCKERKQDFSRSAFPSQNLTASDNLIGKWYYSFPFNSSEITFSNNGTFSFDYNACVGSVYSMGKWYRLGNEITCISFDTSNFAFDYLKLRYEDGFLLKLDKYGKATNAKFGRDDKYSFLFQMHPTEPIFPNKIFKTAQK